MVARTPQAIAELLDERPVEEITGIARRSARKLAGHNIHTCAAFARADRRLIRKLLTKRGEDLWWELNGESVLPIATSRARHKFVARGGSMGVATANPERVWAFVTRNLERLVEALDYYMLTCDRLALSLQFKTGEAASRSVNLPESTARFDTLLEATMSLLPRVWLGRRPVHYMHVIAGRLGPRDCVQLSLFDTSQRARVAAVKQTINERLGRFALRSGATLPLDDLYRDEASSYDICDIYGKTCF